jgi:hypothetical protein
MSIPFSGSVIARVDDVAPPPSSFDKLRMRANGTNAEILILSLSKDEDFGVRR